MLTKAGQQASSEEELGQLKFNADLKLILQEKIGYLLFYKALEILSTKPQSIDA
jgi:hypothetical protein